MPRTRTKPKPSARPAKYARKDWHAPEIHDRKLLRLRRKQNTWPGFFHTVGEIFAAHQTPVVYPKVEIIPTKVWRKRAGGRVRVAEFRKRERDAEHSHGNQVRFYEVPQLDTDIDEMVFEEFAVYMAGVIVGGMPFDPSFNGAVAALSQDAKKTDDKLTFALDKLTNERMTDRERDIMVGLLIARRARLGKRK